MYLFTIVTLMLVGGGAVFLGLRTGLRRRRDAQEQAVISRYLEQADQALDGPETGIDWAGLRRAYIGTLDYVGRSRFDERDSVSADTEAIRTRTLLMRDFPLLSTQFEASEYFKTHPEELGPQMHETCRRRFHELAAHIEATGRDTPEGKTYQALSVDEEYAFLMWLGADPLRQSLVEIDGLPHDRFETDKGAVIFDISMFYELRAVLAMMAASSAAGDQSIQRP